MAIAAAVGVTLAAGAPLGAQQPGRVLQEQQMMRLQEQVSRMNEAMQHMHQIQERARNLEQRLNQEMARLWQHQGVQEGADLPLMLENHERLRTMAHAMAEGARETHRAMEQLRNMVREPGAGWSPEMEREFERLRLHWENMAGEMEQGLAIMERLRDRIGQPNGS
jgi:uncharacterized protein YukE